MTTIKRAIIGLFAAALCAAPLLADGGGEVPQPDDATTKSALLYPSSQAQPDKPLDRMTNDSFDKIEAFYRKSFGPYDMIQPYAPEQGSFLKGFTVIYRIHYKGTPADSLYEFARLEITMPDTAAYKTKVMGSEYLLPEPITSLQRLVNRFGHTQEDYDKLFNEYQWVRFINSWDPASDGPAIGQKYHEKVFGKMSATPPKEKAGDAATRADLEQKEKKMKELQASGDMAGMMALAQEMQAAAGQTGAGEQAQQMQDQMVEGMQKDSWDDWVACLKEMAAAARWTRLAYSGGSGMWWSTEFWQTPDAPVGKKNR